MKRIAPFILAAAVMVIAAHGAVEVLDQFGDEWGPWQWLAVWIIGGVLGWFMADLRVALSRWLEE